jgi:N-acetylmuramoyl-L-alanine amidase
MKLSEDRIYKNPQEGIALAANLILNFPVRLRKDHAHDISTLAKGEGVGHTLYARWDLAWAIGASLYVNFHYNGTKEKQPSGKVVNIYEPTVEISWGTTGAYSVAQALAATNLHQQVIGLAALIEASLSERWGREDEG